MPSRLHNGDFYVLPQSPQIAKQLLMVAGMDRYFQVARCLRDEDLRADRQFEFTQLDIEMSFVSQSDVHDAVTEAVTEAATAVTGQSPGPVPRMTWHQAMDRFGTDKPDLRFAMELVDDPRKTTMPSRRRMAATFEMVTTVWSMLPWRTPR